MTLRDLLVDEIQNLQETIDAAYASKNPPKVKAPDDIADVFDSEEFDDDPFKQLHEDPSFTHSFGYIRGAADALDMTVQELLAQENVT